MLLGFLAEAERQLYEALELATEAGDEFLAAVIAGNLGITFDIRCQWAEALSFYNRAISTFYRIGRRRQAGHIHQNLALSYQNAGLFAEAFTHIEPALVIGRACGSEDDVLRSEIQRALLLCETGDLRLAEITAWRGYTKTTESSLWRLSSEALRILGITARARGDWEDASRYLSNALELSRSTHNLLLEAEVLEEQAVVAQAAENFSAAERLLEESTRIYERIGAPARAQRARARLSPAGVAGHSDPNEAEGDTFP